MTTLRCPVSTAYRSRGPKGALAVIAAGIGFANVAQFVVSRRHTLIAHPQRGGPAVLVAALWGFALATPHRRRLVAPLVVAEAGMLAIHAKHKLPVRRSLIGTGAAAALGVAELLMPRTPR